MGADSASAVELDILPANDGLEESSAQRLHVHWSLSCVWVWQQAALYLRGGGWPRVHSGDIQPALSTTEISQDLSIFRDVKKALCPPESYQWGLKSLLFLKHRQAYTAAFAANPY